jgi:hypothetical protein
MIFGVMSWAIYDAVYGTWGEFGFQMASLIHGGNWPNGEGFKCNSVLWFPPVMFVVLAGYRILESAVKSRAVLAKCCLCVLLWFLRVLCYRYRVLCLLWGIDLALWYLPYFIIGTMAGELIGMIKVRRLFVCSVLVFAAVSFLKFHMPPERLASFSGFSYAISLALSGTCITLSVAKARFWDVRQVSWCGGQLAKIGVASMGIMLLHKFPVVALQERIGIIRSMFCGNRVEVYLAGLLVVEVRVPIWCHDIMDVLKNKSYKKYRKFSRYSNFPYYYNTVDNKYVYGTTGYLNGETPYRWHKIKHGDSFDSLALYYYNNPTLYWVICDFNKIQDPYTELKEGDKLKIPSFSTLTFDK